MQSGRVAAGQVNDYSFTAAAGTLIVFDGRTSDAVGDQIRTRLLNPDGTIVFDNLDARSNRGPLLLEQAGTYKLQTYGASSNTTGDYQFNLLELPSSFASPNLNYLEIGGTVAGNLTARQGKAYTFDGVAGQKFVFNAMTGQNVRATLYDANGNSLFTTDDLQWNRDNGPLTLTQSGLYYLVVENNETANRSYSFQLLDITTAPEIRYSLPTTGSLANGQQSQFFKLQAQAGERLYFDTLASNAPDGYYRWKLFGPGNNLLFDTDQRSDFEVTVPTTGEYYLEFQGGYDTGKVDYSFRILKHEPAVRDVITPGTGETGSNSADSLGLFPVQLAVKDSKGASSVQDFNVKLWADPSNGNPVIISTPETRFSLADKVYQYQLKSVDPDGDALTYRLLDAPLGALINNDTGELLWSPEQAVVSGSTVNFKVEVTDRRGGKAVQSFSVDVYNHLGKIQGAVFDDLNSNGFRDTKLVQGENPAIVLAIDVSGSTQAPFYGVDGNRTSKTVLDAEIAAALALVDAVVAQGGGDRIKFGVIPHQAGAYIQDMDLATDGLQVYTTALADTDHNGIADIRQILESYRPDGNNNFTTALQTIDSLFDVLPGTPNLIFMSDGYGRLDATVANQVVTDIKNKGGSVTGFGVGLYATIDTIRKIDPQAEKVTEFGHLIDIFSGFDDHYAIEPLKENVTVYLDLNNNGVLDESEPFQLTRKDTESSSLGSNRYYYTFDNLLPGTYTLRTVVPSGYTLTTPTTGAFVDTITVAGEEVIHLSGLGNTLEAPNEDPQFVTTPASLTKLKAGETFRYNATARDANADPVTYTLVLAPDGMTVDARTGNVIWTPTKQQVEHYYQTLRAEQERLTALGRGDYAPKVVEFNVLLRASDGRGGQGLQYIKVQLVPDNTAPLFTSTLSDTVKPQVGKPFQYQAKAIDADGDALTYSLLPGAPNGMTINASNGLVNWTPNALGTQAVTIQVTDDKGGTSLQTLSLTVNPATANQAPTITSTPRTTTRLGNTYFYALEASDPDGDRLTYSLESAPGGMTLKSGVISWTPTAAQSGTYTVAVKASDGALATTQTFTLTVSNQTANYAPTITSAPNLVTNLDRTYTYDLTGSDPDGDVVLWSLDKAPAGMIIDAETGALRWQPQVGQIGQHQIVVKLTDNYGLETTQAFTLKVTGTNTPPAIVSTPITRAAQGQAYTYSVVATDPENDVVSFSLGRRPDGMTIAPDGTIRWTPQANQMGSQVVEVLATDRQGGTTTQRFTLEVGTAPINHAPTIISSPVFLAAPGHGYVYQVQASDSDAGDTLTYQLLKAPDGVTINATTGKVEWTSPIIGTYQIVVGAVDSQGVGAAQGFTLTVRENHAPVINSTAPDTAALGTTYRYDVRATDVDGDRLSYALDQASIERGMAIDPLGRLVWTPKQGDLGQTYSVTISVTDEQGVVTPQTFSLTVAQDTQAPNVMVFATQDPINVGGAVTLIARATDNVSVANLTLVVDGKAVVLDADGRATVTLDHTGNIQAIATATDASHNQSAATTTIHVIDPHANFDPTLSFDFSSLKDGVITAPTDLIGTVEGSGITRYELAVVPVSGGEFKTIFTGTGPVDDGVLGKFDPSLLENDSYTVRLTAFDANGNASSIEDTINVSGDLKLGNFRLSFTDLSIPVTGIPITLTRTYDSLTANTTDDFGYGWRMEFRDTDLRTSLKRTPEEELLGTYPAFKDGTRVYITLPGGKREGFTFKPTGDRFNQFFGDAPDAAMYHPAFVADKGITDTLTVRDTRIVHSSGTNQYAGLAGNPYNPADPTYGGVYVLTTKEGVVYEIDAQTGDLLTVTDTNGNKLTYTDASITSSTGQKITFERDAQNRITSVKDPMGELVRYEYDTKGDLVSVTDREENTTRMEYNSDRPHYLESIIDPLGRSGVKTEYDENGRLKTMVDAAGKPVKLAYDPANDIQTVEDQLGNKTTYEYDERGNILTEIDAEGRITKRTYNDNNDVLAETVISDRSDNPLTPELEGFTTRYTYDDRSNLLTETDVLGNTTYYTYDSLGNQLTETDSLGHTVIDSYDSRGNLLSTKDSDGHVTSFSYEVSGLLKVVKDPTGKETIFDYDEYGNLLKTIDILGNSTEYTYDANGKEKTETHWMTTLAGERLAVTTSYTYDAEGRIKTETNAENFTTTYEYDKSGRQTAVIDPSGRRTLYEYDVNGNIAAVIEPDDTPDDLLDNPRYRSVYDVLGQEIASFDELGRETRYVYDDVSRLIETIFVDNTPDTWDDNARIKTEYYTDGSIKATIDERGNRTEYRYDDSGLPFETIYADQTPETLLDNPRSRQTYNKAGQLVQETNTLGYTTTYEYDDAGRLTRTVFHDKSTVTHEYDDLGNRVATTDQNGKRTEYRYDVANRLTGIKDALGYWTEYQFNELGNIIAVKDAEDQITRYEYDRLSRRTTVVLPMGQRSEMTYDAIGNLKTQTDFNQHTTSYVYDARNRLTEKRFQDGSKVSYTYTSANQRDVTSIYNTAGSVEAIYNEDYDVQGRLIQRTDTLNNQSYTASYTYDIAGNRTSVTTGSGTTRYEYDERNWLDKVKRDGVVVADYDYDTEGRLVLTTKAGGIQEERQYDSLNHLLYLENRKDTQILTSYTYTLDAVGNRTRIVEQDGRISNYTYDDLYRLKQESITDAINGDRVTQYDYDRVGNRLALRTTVNGNLQETQYIYDANDRLLAETVSDQLTEYTYDDNGSTLSRLRKTAGTLTEAMRYAWDDEGRLIATVTEDGNGAIQQQTQYQYDTDGMRVSAVVDGEETRYVLDTVQPFTQVLDEVSVDGTVQVSYVYGSDLLSQTRNGTTTFYLVDALGSTRALTNTSGEIVSTYDYDAFGALIASTGDVQNQYLFAGEQYDAALGDYYLRARYYDTQTGRLTKRDFYEGRAGEPITMHKYIYANQNPATMIDPSGLVSMTEINLVQRWMGDLQKNLSSAAPAVLQSLRTASTRSIGILKAVSRNYTKAENLVLKVAKMFKIPALVYGRDMGRTTLHVGRAITGFGFTSDNPYTTGAELTDLTMTKLLPLVLSYESKKRYQWYRNLDVHTKYRPPGYQTDEYPYLKTSQGGRSKYLNGEVSLMPAPKSEQDHQGRSLSKLYRVGKVVPGGEMNPMSYFVNLVSLGSKTRIYDRQGKRHFSQ